MTRDAWSDARLAATQKVLDDDVAALRRRLRLHRAAGAVLTVAVLTVATMATATLAGPALDDTWRPRLPSTWIGTAVLGSGFVLTIVGLATASRAGARSVLVAPEHFLPRQDRRWLRQTIAIGAPVPLERLEVVTDAARRMVRDAASLPSHLGWILLFAGMLVGAPSGLTLVLFSVLTAWRGSWAVREQVLAHRARRWFAQNP